MWQRLESRKFVKGLKYCLYIVSDVSGLFWKFRGNAIILSKILNIDIEDSNKYSEV